MTQSSEREVTMGTAELIPAAEREIHSSDGALELGEDGHAGVFGQYASRLACGLGDLFGFLPQD
jgi:hypothetical protein